MPYKNEASLHLFQGRTVAQLVEVLRYKPEGHGFDSKFFIDIDLLAAVWLRV
jgi:hypothetical protein